MGFETDADIAEEREAYRDRLEREVPNLRAECDRLRTERDGAIAKRDVLARERDAAMTGMEVIARERDAAIRERDAERASAEAWRERYTEQCRLYHDAVAERDALQHRANHLSDFVDLVVHNSLDPLTREKAKSAREKDATMCAGLLPKEARNA